MVPFTLEVIAQVIVLMILMVIIKILAWGAFVVIFLRTKVVYVELL